MQIISGRDEIQELIRSLPKNKKIGRFSFLGNSLHSAHKELLQDIKNNYDIVIANYVGHCFYLNKLLESGYKTPIDTDDHHNIEELKKSFNTIDTVDYLVISNITDQKNNMEIAEEHRQDYLYFMKEAKRLNINNKILKEAVGINLENPLEFCTELQYGIKNLYIALIASKFYKRQVDIRKQFLKPARCIPRFIKDKNENVVSRSKIDLSLSKVRINAYAELKKGKTKFEDFEKLMHDYYIEDPMFTILDIKTVERLPEITDNCILLFMSKQSTESIVIIDGKVIY